MENTVLQERRQSLVEEIEGLNAEIGDKTAHIERIDEIFREQKRKIMNEIKWISVGELLPKKDERVIAIKPKKGYKIPDIEVHYWGKYLLKCGITHWLPLPTLPEDVR